MYILLLLFLCIILYIIFGGVFMSNKVLSSFRLSEERLKELKWLSDNHCVSQGEIISSLIWAMHKFENTPDGEYLGGLRICDLLYMTLDSKK